MKKKQKQVKNRNKNVAILGVIVFFTLYVVSLNIVFVSDITKYPYYLIKCGGKPIAGSTFMAGYTYTLPGDYGYKMFGDKYFCTEDEAKNSSFRHQSNV